MCLDTTRLLLHDVNLKTRSHHSKTLISPTMWPNRR